MLTRRNFPYLSIFAFATFSDCLLILIGIISAVIHGALLPVSLFLFGDIVNHYTEHSKTQISSLENQADIFKSGSYYVCRRFFCIGSCAVLLGYMQIMPLSTAAQNIIYRLKIECFRSILRKEISWFDYKEVSVLQNQIIDDLEKVRAGISDKLAVSIEQLSTFTCSIIIACFCSLKLTMIISSTIPFFLIFGFLQTRLLRNSSVTAQKNYAEAGAIAQTALSSMQTVMAFNGQNQEIASYEEKVKLAEHHDLWMSIYMGFSVSAVLFSSYSTYALALWFGPTMVIEEEISLKQFLSTLLVIAIGGMSVGRGISGFIEIIQASLSAQTLNDLMEKTPTEDGKIVGLCDKELEIEFRNVKFSYPTRPSNRTLNELSFIVRPGSKIAIIGASGSGKTTCASLLQRFYDVKYGSISLAGVNIKEINKEWLRSKISVVSQKPFLFKSSVRENIEFGLPNVSFDEVKLAAKIAQAHNFIENLPNGYETIVGENGISLSGGQMQRIAIARVVLRDTPILIFDEATSALDSESEHLLQRGLEAVNVGKTVFTIAHRLSTIRDSDTVIVLHDGEVVEMGSYHDLKNKGGYLTNLEFHQKLDKATIHDVDSIETSHNPNTYSKRFSSGIINGLHSKSSTRVDSIWYTMLLNKPEWKYIYLGCVFACITTGATPLFAILFGRAIKVFTLSEKLEVVAQCKIWSVLYFLLALAVSISMLLQFLFLAISGNRLTSRLRMKCFEKLMFQNSEFFDMPENSPNSISAILNIDASLVKGASGVRLKSMLESLIGLLIGLGIAFYNGWQLALVILAFIPLIIVSHVFHIKYSSGLHVNEQSLNKDSVSLLSDCIMNIRNVQSLNLESKFIEKYEGIETDVLKRNLKLAHFFGLSKGFTASLMYFLYATSFAYSTWLISVDYMQAEQTFIVIFAIVFAAHGIGQSMSFMPSLAKAEIAALNVNKILNLTVIDTIEERKPNFPEAFDLIKFEHLKFSYPSGKNLRVFEDVDLQIASEKTTAICGKSGCGKSTLFKLLLQFYSPRSGKITIDGLDMLDINKLSLRKRCVLVDQDAVLFNRSIESNISYGIEDDCNQDDIEYAAKISNIHDFICSLPNGYKTVVGDKAVQISGGQKQKIAIARAVIRKPRILLLDEATSSLDTDNEKTIQENLRNLNFKCTVIAVAHRLSTIQNSDKIFVIEDGKVSESGTHQELLRIKKFYFRNFILQ